MRGPHQMSRAAVSNLDETHSSHESARPGVLLLAIGGLSLLGAGALLWLWHGPSVLLENPLLPFLAWCF